MKTRLWTPYNAVWDNVHGVNVWECRRFVMIPSVLVRFFLIPHRQAMPFNSKYIYSLGNQSFNRSELPLSLLKSWQDSFLHVPEIV